MNEWKKERKNEWMNEWNEINQSRKKETTNKKRKNELKFFKFNVIYSLMTKAPKYKFT